MGRQWQGEWADGGSDRRWPARARLGWWRLAVTAWTRLRALPAWAQLGLWVFAWPVTTALYVARSRRLGPLTVPLTVAVLVLGGSLWWPMLHRETATLAATEPHGPWASPPVVGAGSIAFVSEDAHTAEPAEFDVETIDVEIVECVQTRSVSDVRDRTIRQPRIVARVTNRGPARTVVLNGEVMLAGYDWNTGWKATAAVGYDMTHGQTIDLTLLTDFRHQSSYTRDGLRACRLVDVQFIAPHVWPEHPARQVPLASVEAAAAAERDFDPKRDLVRTDAR